MHSRVNLLVLKFTESVCTLIRGKGNTHKGYRHATGDNRMQGRPTRSLRTDCGGCGNRKVDMQAVWSDPTRHLRSDGLRRQPGTVRNGTSGIDLRWWADRIGPPSAGGIRASSAQPLIERHRGSKAGRPQVAPSCCPAPDALHPASTLLVCPDQLWAGWLVQF